MVAECPELVHDAVGIDTIDPENGYWEEDLLQLDQFVDDLELFWLRLHHLCLSLLVCHFTRLDSVVERLDQSLESFDLVLIRDQGTNLF